MANFVLNIGLNVGLIEPLTQYDNVLYHLNNTLGKKFNYELMENLGGNWGNERTLKVDGETKLTFVEFKNLLIELCRLTMQDAIAFTYRGYGDIAYNKGYKDEFYEFNEQYFIN